MVHYSHTFEINRFITQKKIPDIANIIRLKQPLLNSWTKKNYWLICFTLIYQLDLALQLNFVADNIILIFSQPNVNIIDTEIHPINSLHISNKAK